MLVPGRPTCAIIKSKTLPFLFSVSRPRQALPAEITDVAVLTDPEKKLKMAFRSPQVTRAVALLDPVLTLTLPPEPTRDSGLDALTHAIESYISVNAWRPTAVLRGDWLDRAVSPHSSAQR